MTPFIGMVTIFAGNFAPRGWALCDGQLLPIANYSALFSILGTTYGGDGVSTFALPDLRGRAPIHAGTGSGLSSRKLGSKGGSETVTLTSKQIPPHTHTLSGSNSAGDNPLVANNVMATSGTTVPPAGPYSAATPNSPMNANAISSTGGGQSHNNMQPFLTLNYIIALEGVYPSRN